MRNSLLLLTAAIILGCSVMIAAEPDAAAPAIKEIDAKPTADIFKAAKRNEPLALRTAEEAAKYFDKDALAVVEKKVDFEKQLLLVFAWRGSGQDKLTYDIAESFPEQIQFKIKPGRTKDLRPHLHVFALRSNVKWSVGVGR